MMPRDSEAEDTPGGAPQPESAYTTFAAHEFPLRRRAGLLDVRLAARARSLPVVVRQAALRDAQRPLLEEIAISTGPRSGPGTSDGSLGAREEVSYDVSERHVLVS
jgi:hypothetical protein